MVDYTNHNVYAKDYIIGLSTLRYKYHLKQEVVRYLMNDHPLNEMQLCNLSTGQLQ